jgi:Cof subfamily protein (haloacid dehalogenase superfamily)
MPLNFGCRFGIFTTICQGRSLFLEQKNECMVSNDIVRFVATDLDGTLLRDDKSISMTDWASLELLARKNIVRVAATGRSMYKVFEVLPEDSPFDYIVFSSGGGIFDWRKKKLLVSEHFESEITPKICSFLIRENLNFLLFRPIPENNLFQYHRGAESCFEFEGYLKRHEGDFSELNEEIIPTVSGQFLAIIPNDEFLFENIKEQLRKECRGIRVIRTTSPVDSRFIWLEIFPETVSKGHGLKWLCDFLGIHYANTLGVGNDFNDLDMFDFVGKPYLLGNSPSALKKVFPSVSETNNQSGFSRVLQILEI